jgi:PAS domain S-box-containing protein
MQDQDKTKEQLIGELEGMRQRVSLMETTEARLVGMGKALRESEKRFWLLYEHAPLGYQRLDENGYFLEVNQAWLDTLGYERQEVIGRGFGDLLVPDYQDRFGNEFTKFKTAGEIHWVEFNMLRKDGTQVPVALGGQIEREEDGRFKWAHCIIHEISKTKGSQEDALDRVSQEWERTFNAISDLVMVLDDQHKILRANKAMADALQTTEPDLIGKLCFELVHGEKEPPVFCPHVQLLADGREHSAEVVEPRLGGIYDVRVSPLVGQNGQITGSVHVTRDITEQKKAEAAIRQQRDFLQQLIDTIPTPIFYKDVAGRYMGCNTAFESDTGMSRADIVGKTVFDVAPPALAQTYHEEDLSLLRDPGVQQGEARRQDASGYMHDVMVRKATFSDLHGNVAGLVGVIFDITERKKVERELQLSNSLLRAIIEAAPIAIIGLDLDGNVQMVWNPAAEKMLGWSRDEVMGRPLPSVLADSQEEFRGFRERIRSGKTLDGVEVRRQKRDGTPIDYSIYASPLHDAEGRISGNIAVLVDITERKRSEQIMQARLRLIEFANTHTLEELLQATLDEAERLTDSTIGFYHFVDPDEKMVTLQAWSTNTLGGTCTAEGKGSHYSIDKAGVWVDCIRERRPVIHNDYSALPHRKGMPKGHAPLVRELVTPVFRGDKIVALLGVGNKPKHYDQNDVKATVMLADIAWDIAERKRADEALRASESFLNSVIDQSPYPMWISDHQGTLVRANQALRDLLHISDEEVVGKYNIRQDNIVEEQGYLPLVKRVFERGDTVRFEIKYESSRLKSIQLRQSASIILDVTIFPIKDSGGKVKAPPPVRRWLP